MSQGASNIQGQGAGGRPPPTLPPEQYTVGWICAIPTELIAAKAMLETRHGPLKAQPRHDENNYHLGRIGEHNVVIACLPRYGNVDAAVAGKSMQNTFPNLRFGLMVGVGGGIPSPDNDIRLGDIAVSMPSGQAAGVIQYDMGKHEDSGFRRTGFLNSPPTLLLSAIQSLRAERTLGKELKEMVNRAFAEDDDEEWRFPANEPDILYKDEDGDSHKIKERKPRASPNPKCFYGNIGSGNSVIKSAVQRRRLAADGDLICFEMEAAGLMNFFRCIVIRGICDYADKHKHKKWQPYAAAVAAAYAKKLLSVISAGEVEKTEPIKKNQHWVVPRQINPHFTGRRQLLRKLRERLCTENDNVHDTKQKRFIICGMGGSGKSEVCLKFAYENRESFWGVFWIDASDEDSIKRGIADAYKRAGNVGDIAYDAAKQWFQNLNKSWLLIFDNADNTNLDYFKFFPSGGSGCILMSTRVPECQQYNTVGYQDGNFEQLGEEDAVELLLKSAGILREKWAQVSNDARKVVAANCLSQHALAITQAGAFIHQGLSSLQEYPAMFIKERKRLLEHHRKQADSPYGDVYATFEVSARALEAGKSSHRQNWVDALELLNVLAFLHREGVPEEMFTNAWMTAMTEIAEHSEDGIWLCSLWHVNHARRLLHPSRASPTTLDIISLREARNALQSFSLITVHPDTGDISMHPLIHAWAKDRLAEATQTIAWATSGSLILLSIENNSDYREFFLRIQSHIEFCVGPQPEQLFENNKYLGLEICRILFRFARVMRQLRNDRLAGVLADLLCSRIGIGYEISLKSRNWRKLLHLQASCQENLGNYNESLNSLQKVVAWDKKNLPPEDVESLDARIALGSAYIGVRQYPQAIGVLKLVVQITETLAPTHPHRLASQHKLAMAYLENNQVEKAIEISEKVVRIQEEILAPTHPNYLASQHGLGSAYLENNQVEKAIEIFEKVVRIREEILAPTHPDRLASQHGLASAYLENNQVEKAIEILKKVVRIEEILAPTHPDRLSSQHGLAWAYYKYGQYWKALPIIQEVVRIDSQQLEPGDRRRVLSEKLLSHCLAAIHENGINPEQAQMPALLTARKGAGGQQESDEASLEGATPHREPSSSIRIGDSSSRKQPRRPASSSISVRKWAKNIFGGKKG